MGKKIRIYTDMVADLFHRGHVEFLKKVSKLEKNKYIIVGIHSDETVSSYKRKPIFNMEDRAEIIKFCDCVDEVILNAPLLITKDFIKLYKIDIVVHGNDMTDFLKKYNYPVPIEMGIMREVEYWKDISTTSIIEKIKNIYINNKG